ncbi:MAG: hypothetical protein GXZ18_07855 [Synergistaceae bacterium]|nr:hypothetical protein [Synergistaceae bacterium]
MMITVLFFAIIFCIPAAILRFIILKQPVSTGKAIGWAICFALLHHVAMIVLFGKVLGGGISPVFSYFILKYEKKPKQNEIN